MIKLILFLAIATLYGCGPSFTVKCYYKNELLFTSRTNFQLFTGGDEFDKCYVESDKNEASL